MYEDQIGEKMSEIISHRFEKCFGRVMSIKNRLMSTVLILFLLLPISFLGCGGGGGDSPTAPPPDPSIQVFPSSYDFGIVTPGNDPLPLEVRIANNGSEPVTLSSITLSDTTNYAMNLNPIGAANPCGSASSTIDAGNNCTLEIDFTPTEFKEFPAILTIESDDSVAPTIALDLFGTNDDGISELNVQINQVVLNCPDDNVTAYVSVTDQGGSSVNTLTTDNFSVTEGVANPVPPTNVSFVSDASAPVPISVALVMDYSGSITDVEDARKDMEESVKSFVGEMGSGDETEIIKFDSIWEVVQSFTSDKNALTAAIDAPWDNGRETVLYDAVYKAVQDVAARSNDRKAVIVITDGADTISSNGLMDVIDLGKADGVPVFAIGLGNIDETILEQMAVDTSGKYYLALTSDNLKTIYQQLASVLYKDQYVLTYTSTGSGSPLTISASLNGIEGSATKDITTCP